jgi:hypothetical protein
LSINWQDVLTTLVTTVGGGGVLLAAFAWLTKAIITDRLARDAEDFKTRLQANADAEIERLKSSLQMQNLEHQVRFSKLHERRAEVIAEVYARLVTLFHQGRLFVVSSGWAKEGQEANFAKIHQTLRDFLSFVEKNRIYIPIAACGLLDNITSTMHSAVINVGVYGGVEYPNEETRNEINDVFMKAFKTFEEEIPEAKKALDRKFREILGDDPPEETHDHPND